MVNSTRVPAPVFIASLGYSTFTKDMVMQHNLQFVPLSIMRGEHNKMVQNNLKALANAWYNVHLLCGATLIRSW